MVASLLKSSSPQENSPSGIAIDISKFHSQSSSLVTSNRIVGSLMSGLSTIAPEASKLISGHVGAGMAIDNSKSHSQSSSLVTSNRIVGAVMSDLSTISLEASKLISAHVIESGIAIDNSKFQSHVASGSPDALFAEKRISGIVISAFSTISRVKFIANGRHGSSRSKLNSNSHGGPVSTVWVYPAGRVSSHTNFVAISSGSITIVGTLTIRVTGISCTVEVQPQLGCSKK